MYPAGMGSVENMEYITGYNSDAGFDEAINAVRVKMHINQNSPKYNVWKSYMDISKDAKRVPNVSIFGFYKSKAIRRSVIPSGTVIPESVLHGEYVVAMAELIPFAITTCLKENAMTLPDVVSLRGSQMMENHVIAQRVFVFHLKKRIQK